MRDDSTDDSKSIPISRILPGPAHLRTYPAHDLVTWQPQGVLDDRLLDEIGEWLCDIEKAWSPLRRFVDFSRLTTISVRTRHVFTFAQKRARESAGNEPVRTALFCEEWVGFGVARLYEALMEETRIEAHAFRDRVRAAQWLGVPVEVLSLTDEPEPA